MLLFLFFVFYHYNSDKKRHIRHSLFLEMKNYSLTLKDKRFDIDIVDRDRHQQTYELYEDDTQLYILVPFPDTEDELLKIWYPKDAYLSRVSQMQSTLVGYFILLLFVAMALSFVAARYTLQPLRSALHLLEEFIKDIIHDLNTPLSAILINLKMIKESNIELESIRSATNTIAMLHQNLDAYLREQKHTTELFSLESIIEEQIAFFKPIHPHLDWQIDLDTVSIHTDKQAMSRIVYNLLSNACKYNTKDGKIDIALTQKSLSIRNTSHGVKHPESVFERFYKESERGLGIGLHIVAKLCETLHITKYFEVENNLVIVRLDISLLTKD